MGSWTLCSHGLDIALWSARRQFSKWHNLMGLCGLAKRMGLHDWLDLRD